ncbi:hypothetical protein F4808DRAFT_262064 [Astrocystis sublimbata]|nr:hypothetical protein F4808DRAFT_262064 [Astrocystis sublimbata]
MPSASRRSQQSASWQDKLEEVCRDYQISPPDYQLVSDRRGGRTAWSSVVHVYGQRFQARYWYDGNNLNNAREDAAEAAFLWLNSSQ